MSFIYCITDPISDRVIYIGQTTNPSQRIQQHFFSDNELLRQEMHRIKEAGSDPVLKIIEQCDRSKSNERERHWIDFHISNGCTLLNRLRKGKKFTNNTPKVIQFPKALLASLETDARNNGLSVNTYIIHLLTKATK